MAKSETWQQRRRARIDGGEYRDMEKPMAGTLLDSKHEDELVLGYGSGQAALAAALFLDILDVLLIA